MAISQEFKQAVQAKDIRLVRIMLKDNLVIDPTFMEFEHMKTIAEGIVDLYDEHDGESLKTNPDTWTKDYLDEQMIQVVYNFSRQRIDLLKRMCRHLFGNRVAKIERERQHSTYQNQIKMSRTQIGTGLTAGGVITTAVGIAVAKPVVIAVGTAAIVVGGACLLSDRMEKRI